jgi:asparagine synthase (glutamine-hydrolysing)
LLLEENGETQGPIRYWDLKFQPDHRVKESEWIERIDAGLRDAVRAHLVSDVPFGAFLSGGVDSSIVVAYMSQLLQEPVRTFTAGFDDDEYDERPHARFVSESAGTKHFEELVNFDVFDVLEQMVSHCGEPFADSSIICTYLVSRLARGQVKMVLSGDGGDETFAGYDYYGKMLSQHPLPQGFLRRTRRTLGNWARRAGLRHPLPSARQTWYERTPYFSESQRLKLWRPEFHSTLRHTRLWNDEQFEPIRNADLLSQCQYVDMHNYLPYNNLHKVDIASMCHGLEVRVPFLDHRFLEMVAGIPAEMKWRSRKEGGGGAASPQGSMTGKYILKKMAERFFPPEFLYRPKQGFSMPVPSWFAGPLHGELREHLNDSTVGLGEFFDMAYVRSMIEEHHHQKNHGWRLWALLFLAEWNRERKPPDLGRLQAYNNL